MVSDVNESRLKLKGFSPQDTVLITHSDSTSHLSIRWTKDDTLVIIEKIIDGKHIYIER